MLIAHLVAGAEVTSTEISGALTRAEWQRFQLHLHSGRAPTIPGECRSYLREYLERLRAADVLYRSGERALRERRPARHLIHRAEAAYEHALEALSEAIGDCPAIAHYLTPFPAFDSSTEWKISLCPAGMPRETSQQPAPVMYSQARSVGQAETVIALLREAAQRLVERGLVQ